MAPGTLMGMDGARDQLVRRAAGIRLLEAEPELAHGLPPDQEEEARRHVVAVLESLPPGPWQPDSTYGEDPGFLGLLLIDGMIARDVEIGGRRCSELLGPGDVLRPADYDDSGMSSVPSEAGWSVLEPTRVAILDRRFAGVACRWPELIARLVGRTLRRSQQLAILLTISSMPRVDARVHALLWHLADRWGRVTLDGVVVPVRLTHDMIGRLVGAHRPSVTTALSELARSGRISRQTDGWLLRGSPPEQMAPASRTTNRAVDAASLIAALPAAPALLGALLA
jgi:CRP-like cAMP-binding protein